jgi:hypothetical protein
MSRFKRTVPVKRTVEGYTDDADVDYAGAHPMLHSTPNTSVQRDDHLDNYVRVSPFQDAEMSWPFGKKTPKEESLEIERKEKKLEKKKKKLKEKLAKKKKQDTAKAATREKKDLEKKKHALTLRKQQAANAPTKIVAALVAAKKLVDTELANKYTIVKEANGDKEMDVKTKESISNKFMQRVRSAAITLEEGGELGESETKQIITAYKCLSQSISTNQK